MDCPDLAAPLPDPELIALNESPDRLAGTKPDHARQVQLRFFSGMTV